MTEAPKFSLGQSVAFKGKLYRIVAAEIMGVTGWRYSLRDESGRECNYIYGHELTKVG